MNRVTVDMGVARQAAERAAQRQSAPKVDAADAAARRPDAKAGTQKQDG
jgi:hypothetical protein